MERLDENSEQNILQFFFLYGTNTLGLSLMKYLIEIDCFAAVQPWLT